jgi:hypothetical protein
MSLTVSNFVYSLNDCICFWVVTFSCFSFNAIIVIHLLELTFEFSHTPSFNDNKFRSRVTWQPGVIKQILDGCCWLICDFDNFKPTSDVLLDLLLWVQAESVFWLVSLLWMDPPDPHKPWHRDTMSDSAILGGSSPYFLRSFFVIWHTWQVEHKRSNSCVRPGHVMVFLTVFFVLVCPGWSKYSWYQDSTLCYLSQWLKNVDFVYYLCNKEDHTLQYVVLSTELGLSPLFLILCPWIFFVLWRST